MADTNETLLAKAGRRFGFGQELIFKGVLFQIVVYVFFVNPLTYMILIPLTMVAPTLGLGFMINALYLKHKAKRVIAAET